MSPRSSASQPVRPSCSLCLAVGPCPRGRSPSRPTFRRQPRAFISPSSPGAGCFRLNRRGAGPLTSRPTQALPMRSKCSGSWRPPHGPRRREHRGGLRFRVARTCYDHLAGALSVALAQRLELDGMVRSANARSYEVTDRGVCWLAEEMDIDVVALAKERRMLARRCIDGTERRPHVGGALG